MGTNSRLGTYLNKYGTPDPVENIKFFNILVFLMFPCKSNLLFSDATYITFVHQQKGMNMSSYILHQFALNSEMEVLSPGVTNE